MFLLWVRPRGLLIDIVNWPWSGLKNSRTPTAGTQMVRGRPHPFAGFRVVSGFSSDACQKWGADQAGRPAQLAEP
jgi:hypothetical protein